MSDWTDFMKGRMGPYIKKYGSYKKAIKALAVDYKKKKK